MAVGAPIWIFLIRPGQKRRGRVIDNSAVRSLRLQPDPGSLVASARVRLKAGHHVLMKDVLMHDAPEANTAYWRPPPNSQAGVVMTP